MQFSFDLISDLHVETWDSFDWTDQATSPYCVVVGDVARDPVELRKTLAHLGECYQGGVFYIDGNEEHKNSMEDLGDSYRELVRNIENIKNVVYLQDHVVIVNGCALLATNGWWSYDFDNTLDFDQSQEWYKNKYNLSQSSVDQTINMAFNDTAYLINSVKKLQTHQDVRAIIMITHTVPTPELTNHDIDLVDTWRYNHLGNRHLVKALNEDSENKVKAWCFGHYHKGVDRELNGIRFVNNCRGRGDTPWCQPAYYPKKITIEI